MGAQQELLDEVIELRPGKQLLDAANDKLEQKRVKKRRWKLMHTEAERRIEDLNSMVENLKMKFLETHGNVDQLKVGSVQRGNNQVGEFERNGFRFWDRCREWYW
jgi:excinuclease UvrABC helicase subunit UvrB